MYVEVADIRVAESTAKGRLRSVPEEPAKFTKAHDHAWTKAKASEAIFRPDINVEVFETVVSIKIEPLESAFCRIALQVDMRGASHGYQSICRRFVVGEKSPCHQQPRLAYLRDDF
jgi:hypothetical protein